MRAPWNADRRADRHGARRASGPSPPAGRRSRLAVAFVPPFCLESTVAALQRLPTNAVDVWSDGRYLRAFDTIRGPVTWAVREDPGRPRLTVDLSGDAGGAAPWRRLVERMLGTPIDLGPFHALADGLPPVRELARAFRGLKPPRFGSLWETFVNTIVFQQLSLAAGVTIVGRLVARFAGAVEVDGRALFPFPPAELFADARGASIRAAGLSSAKARSLKACARALAGGTLREDDLEALDDEEAARRLQELPGIGPWTASLVLLRGLGRLGVFPAGDAGASRGLSALAGERGGAALVEALGPYRGMLYFLLLLRSLEGRRAHPPRWWTASDAAAA